MTHGTAATWKGKQNPNRESPQIEEGHEPRKRLILPKNISLHAYPVVRDDSLTPNQTNDSLIKDYIVTIVKTWKPETATQLVEIVQKKYPLKQQEITDLLVQLENEGKIHFTKKETHTRLTLREYTLSSKATWFWVTIAVAAATSVAAFTIPEDAFPLVYVRYVLGAAFILGLPGYALVKALFPRKKEMDSIERASLSMGLSLALVPMVGLLLNYTPWGIRLTPIILSLLALTAAFAAAALVREYQVNTEEAQTASTNIRL